LHQIVKNPDASKHNVCDKKEITNINDGLQDIFSNQQIAKISNKMTQ